jgi:hypothetical protein
MIRTISPGMIQVTGSAILFCGPWAQTVARKGAWCKLSGRRIMRGDKIYRPVTNALERSQRVLAEVLERHASYDDELMTRSHREKRR